MSSAVTSDLDNAPARLLLTSLTSTIACVALADWLRFLRLRTWLLERYLSNNPQALPYLH